MVQGLPPEFTVNESPIEILTQELSHVRAELRAIEARRRRGWRAVTAIAATAGVLWGMVSFASPFLCGTLPYGLACFSAGSAAVASEVNGNFKIIADALDGGQVATLGLGGRVSTLEGQLTALQARPIVLSGTAAFGSPSAPGCTDVTHPCVINFIPPSPFTAPPTCVVTPVAPDSTGYREVAVIVAPSVNSLAIWRGQNVAGGSTLVVNWVCVGK